MPPLDSDRGRIDDVTLDASGFEQAVDPRRSSNAPPSPAVT
jgi:hypothetical protein